MRLNLLAPGALCAAQLWLFGTAAVYGRNVAEFEFAYRSSLPILALLAGLQLLLFALPGLFLPDAIRRRYQVFLLSLGVLLWVQSAFLVWDYGAFDGQPIDWSKTAHLNWIDLALWAAVLVLGQFLHRELQRFCVIVPLGLLVMQSALLAWTASSWGAHDDEQIELGELMAQFSPQQNIVHVIMDGFHTDTFVDLVDTEGWDDEFDGFTVYLDNLAPSSLTALALPAIFSGDIYDGSLPPGAYHERSMGQRGFQNLLFDAGWRVQLVPKVDMSIGKHHTHAVTPTGFGLSRQGRKRRQAWLLADLSLFRAAPAVLRPAVFQEGNWLLSSRFAGSKTGSSQLQRDFFEHFSRSIEATSNRPVYNFIHLMPPHPPFSTLADGSYAGRTLEHTRENYTVEAKYTLKMFLAFLQQLREQDLYDSSLIVLQSDHGYGFNKTEGEDELRPRGFALMAIKPPESRGPLLRSDAPTSTADIAVTILKWARIPNELAGIPVDEHQPLEERERLYSSYAGMSTHGDEVQRYLVTGPIRDPNSWHQLEPRKIAFAKPQYRWGDELSFRLGNDMEQYLGDGWCIRDITGCRKSCARRADLRFEVETTPFAITLELFVTAYVEQLGTAQSIRIHCNGVFVGKAVLAEGGRQQIRLNLPAGTASTGKIELSLRMPDSISNAEGGGRRYSICLQGLTMAPLSE